VWKDTPNFLVTTDDILGDWSEPTFLSSTGFDGSLFHDVDGRKYYLSMLVDHRRGKFFGGVTIQEYVVAQQKLIGTAEHFFPGTELGLTEGPHLYRKDGYYFLITAEGGTEYNHAVSVARSKSLKGPYEVHPDNPLLSARDHPAAPLQKTGHGDMVEGSILSDDYVQDANNRYRPAFTGAFVGICCQDLSGHGATAAFSNWKCLEPRFRY
jgi:xylan 1,4-beta-xylosidase